MKAVRKKAARRSTVRLVERLRRRYTRVVKIGDKWNCYLQVDHQGFCVVEQATRRRARWYAKMLAVALTRLRDDSMRELKVKNSK